MKKQILIAIGLTSVTALGSSFNIIINKNESNYTIGTPDTDNPNPDPDPITRNMCFDILNRGESTGNGVYSVDPDGEGNAYTAKNAYCDMDNGGWTLYDSFGTELKQISASNPVAFNGNNLNTGTAARSAGYATYLDQINTTVNGYHVEPAYLQWHQSYSDKGYIKKNMPDWADIEIRVDASNEWSSSTGRQALYYNGVMVHDIAPKTTHNSYILDTSVSGMEFKMQEIGMFWIDSIWVK